MFGPLLAQCQLTNEELNEWATPTNTVELPLEWDWAVMAKLDGWQAGNITSVRPMFFPEEPDSNQGDKPRLDIMITMSDRSWVRYHPGAAPISSTDRMPTEAMQKRYDRIKKLPQKHGHEY